MYHPLKIGFSFGLTSGIITTLGLMVGLHAGTHSKMAIFSFRLAREQKAKPWRVVSEHLLVAIAVIIITHYLGDWISLRFG